MTLRSQSEIVETWGNYDVNRPLVSVQCCTYNQEKYIADALNGFLIQKTTFPFEVIVHDDASTDKTASIIREYEKNYPDIIKPIYEIENQYSKHDGSLSRIVRSFSKGKYIAYCEGDDYWIDENKLQMQVDFLENNSAYILCFHGAKILNINDINCNLSFDVEDKDYTPTELYTKWTVPTASIVMRREVFDFPIQNRDLFWAGDIVIVESAAHMGKVHGFSNKMSVYRITKNGATWKREEISAKAKKYIQHHLNLALNFPKIKKREIYKTVSDYYLTLAWHSNKVNRLYYILKSFRYGGFYIFKSVINRYKKLKVQSKKKSSLL